MDGQAGLGAEGAAEVEDGHSDRRRQLMELHRFLEALEQERFDLLDALAPASPCDGARSAAPAQPCSHPVEDGDLRATVAAAASYDPADRYVLFELRPTEVRCDGYGDVELPEHRRWRESG